MEQDRRDQRPYYRDNWTGNREGYNRADDDRDDYEDRDRRNADRSWRGYNNENARYEGGNHDYERMGGSGSDATGYGYGNDRENINEYGFGGYSNSGSRQYGRGNPDRHSGYDNYERWNDREYGPRRERGNQERRSSYRGDWGRNREGRQERDWWDRTRDEVSSWFGDDEAQRRRNMDNRHENHRGRGPRNYKRSDDRIREDVCDRLSDDYHIDASDVDIKVKESEVILSGTVDSREAKRRAEDIAESVSGVTNVQNQLRVHRPGSPSYQGQHESMGSTTGTTGTTNR